MARRLARLPPTVHTTLSPSSSGIQYRAFLCAYQNPDQQSSQLLLTQRRRLHPSHCYNTSFANKPPLSSTSTINNANHKQRQFSTAKKASKATLRKLIRPFLIACHPDASHFSNDDGSTEEVMDETYHNKKKRMSKQAKAVNLKAVQTLNGLVDTCDELITRCTSTDHDRAGQIPELEARYEVEFMLPSNKSSPARNELRVVKNNVKKKREIGLSLRSVVIEFPTRLREEVRQMALTRSTKEEEAILTGISLKKHVEKELGRLLVVAGLEYEGTSTDIGEENEESFGGQERKHEGEWTLSDHFLHELGIDPMEDITPKSPVFYGRNGAPSETPPPGYARLKDARQKFVDSIRWDKFRDMYDDAFEDAKADSATARMGLYNPNTKEGRARREQLVSEICSRAEIWMGGHENGDDNQYLEIIPEGLDVVAQLVAIRRLSTVLLDNFEYLNMEKMGRMWENLVIVFTPPRDGRRRHLKSKRSDTNDQNVVRRHSSHPGRKLKKWERKMKKRERTSQPERGFMRRVAEYHFNTVEKKQQANEDNDSNEEEQSPELSSPSQVSESGFKFSYGGQKDQGSGQVIAYIPIDFGDYEIVRQLHVYLYDYFDNCCSDSGFLKVAPDGTLTANVAGFNYDDVGETAAN